MPELTLWLLRHAKTVTDPPKGGSDFDRVLAPRGRRDATALGQVLATNPGVLGVDSLPLPQLALVSPAARTAATADLVLPGLNPAPPVRLVDDLYSAEPEEVLDQLRALPTAITSVMVVGHNPTAHALSQGLISKADRAGHTLATQRGFPTCALGIYRFSDATWSTVSARGATLAALCIPPFGVEGTNGKGARA